MNNTEFDEGASTTEPIIKKAHRFSFIWLLPIGALLLCVGLLFYAFSQQGVQVTLQLISAQGIVPGKTVVSYNGVTVGQVDSISTTKDLQGVVVKLSMDEKFSLWLTTKTEFWLVKPNVSLSGVTGLEALVSGNYIAVRPDKSGKPTRSFKALDKPPVEDNLPGLHISLLADKLPSVSPGSPVSYNGIQVGEVTGYLIMPEAHTIKIDLVIEPEYEDLVHHNSRFWNTSGIDISASLKGLKINAESLASIIKGGIAFNTPEWEPVSAKASNGDQFILYKNYNDAKAGIRVTIEFPLTASAVKKNTPIVFHGIQVGSIHSIIIDRKLDHITAEAYIDPVASELLVEGAHFWLIRPSLSLGDTSDLSSLINGSYIAVDSPREAIEKGISKTSFTGYVNRSYSPLNLPGLRFTLRTPSIDGIKQNAPLLYKGVSIGKVLNVSIGKNGEFALIDVSVDEDYEYLVNSSSLFVNSSGVSFAASLSGIQIKTPSLLSILSGGITVTTPDLHALPIKQGSIHNLTLPNQRDNHKGLMLALVTNNLGSIKVGQPLLYLGVPVGKVVGYHLDNPASHVIIEVIVYPPYQKLVSLYSKFWNVSGVKLNAGLFSGIQMQAQSLQTIAMGGIAFATPALLSDDQVKNGQRFFLHDTEKPEWKKWHPAIPIGVNHKSEQKK